ncbi:MAG: restriction endonuclease subunit S [Geminicoccaceae bacterium]
MNDASAADTINNYSLPKGWARAKLGSILPLQYGKGLTAKHRKTIGDVPVYGSSGIVGTHDEALTSGPVIIVGRKGSVGSVFLSKEACWPIDTVYFSEPSRSLDPAFFSHLLSHLNLSRLDRSTAVPGLIREDYDVLEVAIPPSPEQQRIVAKIDELFSELDAGVASLKRARALLKRYRQAVLKAAVTGELTRGWRERHRGQLKESGAELLQRILKARRAAWEAAGLKKLRAKGKPPKDDGWKQNYKEPQPPDPAGLPALPEGWVWATLDALAEVVGGVTKDAKREARGGVSVPYLRVANVQRGYLDLSKVKEIIVDTDTVASLRLVRNDILFNEGGDIHKLGRGWIWQDELPECIHQNHVFRARLHLSEFSAKFVSWFANAIGQEYFMREGKQTTNLASVSLSKLKIFPVPVPPCEEIAEIEAELERQLTVLDAFESLTEQEMRRCSALRQSILKAAFAGRLVSQDPDDEPASVLLERIRAERAARPRPARGRRRKVEAGARQLELPVQ